MDTRLQAEGTLYLDDGDSLDSVAAGNYSLYILTASRDGIRGRVTGVSSHVTLDEVVVYGLDHTPSAVTVNNVTASFNWASDTQVRIYVAMTTPLHVAIQVLYIGTNCSNFTSGLDIQWTL